MKKKLIKQFVAREFNQIIGGKAIKKLDSLVDEKIKKILEKASRNALFAGRKSIKKEDITE